MSLNNNVLTYIMEKKDFTGFRNVIIEIISHNTKTNRPI